jgi:hypothetical protein
MFLQGIAIIFHARAEWKHMQNKKKSPVLESNSRPPFRVDLANSIPKPDLVNVFFE